MSNVIAFPEQGSAEWHAERAGRWTGSKFVDVLARAKRAPHEPLKAYYDLIWQVVGERLSGRASESISAAALKWGHEVEPFAREAYELDTGNIVTPCGFIRHPQHDYTGASPDGLISADGTLEIKSPIDRVIQLQRWRDGLPEEYRPQIQGQLWVTGRQWCDFVSFHPELPEQFRFLKIRVTRDDAYIATLETAVIEAEQAAVDLIAQLQKLAA